MFRSTCLALLGVLAAAACSTAERVPADDSPRNLTAVVELRTANYGIKGFPPSESTSRIQTRAAMQRVDTRVKGTGTVTRFVVGGQNESSIARVDRKLAWTIDHKEKTYAECPLKGCRGGGPAKVEDKAAEPDGEDKTAVPDCQMRIVRSALTVKRTGERRTISGFDTDQFRVTWVARLQDAKKRQTESTLGLEVWAAAHTPALKEALAMEAAYDKAFAGAVAGGAKKQSLVPDEAASMIDGYLSQYLAPADRVSFMKAGKELGRVKGYPVLTELEWKLKGESCLAEKAAVGEAADSEDKRIFAFTLEVKSHQVEPVHDSAFLPPAGYKQAP